MGWLEGQLKRATSIADHERRRELLEEIARAVWMDGFAKCQGQARLRFALAMGLHSSADHDIDPANPDLWIPEVE